jgi:NAD(P)-dependent dehydrogenase (short-subunit alcohol dehydrogenase family)
MTDETLKPVSDKPLCGRIALITGASSGLGRHFASVLAAAGARLVVGARRVDRLATLVEDIAAIGGEALAVVLDVTDEASVRRAYDSAEDRFGAVTAIVANAGISVAGRATEMAVEDFDAHYAVNVRGAFLTAREGARRLQLADRGAEGRVVLISSITARTQTSGLSAYSSSKAAVSHLGRLLAREWARTGPNVNVISPGYIRTELAGEFFDAEAGARQVASWPRRRMVEANALDATLLHLLSDAGAQLTGADITIDDGQSL